MLRSNKALQQTLTRPAVWLLPNNCPPQTQLSFGLNAPEISAMTLAQLLTKVTWPHLKAAIVWAYPDAKDSFDAYRLVLAKLKQLQPAPSAMRIVITETFRQGIDDKAFLEVIGRNGCRNRDQQDFRYFEHTVDDGYADAETDWSLSLRPWEEWLGMEIDASTLDKFDSSEIAAHCIWDMTFHGFEQGQVQSTLAEIMHRADEIDAMSEEEREKHLVPADKVLSKLGKNQDAE
ncbi:MAG: hypothetical protein HKN49_13915 [Gammaproteobacteria bacterium]|nr:hypothetical protein [Gammaproteobacteria bacterium]